MDALSSLLYSIFWITVLTWSLIGIYKDAIIKRDYQWLIKHYLEQVVIDSPHIIEELASIEKNDGCSMYAFRKRIMIPLREIYENK